MDKRITVVVSEELHEAIRTAAFKREMSMAAFVRYALQGVAEKVVAK